MRGKIERDQPAGSRFGPLGFPIGHPFATDEGGNERERAALVAEVARLKQNYQQFQLLAILDEPSIARFLSSLAEDIEQPGATDRERIQDVLKTLVERISLDPDTLRCDIKYQIDLSTERDKLASPRGFEPLLPP